MIRILHVFTLTFCFFLISMVQGAESVPTLPRGTSLCVLKTGEEPAKIVIIQRGRMTEVSENNIADAPESVRPYLQAMFKNIKAGQAIEGSVKDLRNDDLEISYRIDPSAADVPGIEDWAIKAANLCIEWHPKLTQYLATEGHTPPNRVRLEFKKMDGVAYSSGDGITISSDWVKNRPDDWGMVVHELVHVIQGYRRGGPGWVTEGIADYIRHAQFEPDAPMRRFDPDRAKYTDAYQITASFFMWLEKNKCKDIVPKLNAAMRKGEYDDTIFEKECGARLDDLWKEYIESVKAVK